MQNCCMSGWALGDKTPHDYPPRMPPTFVAESARCVNLAPLVSEMTLEITNPSLQSLIKGGKFDTEYSFTCKLGASGSLRGMGVLHGGRKGKMQKDTVVELWLAGFNDGMPVRVRVSQLQAKRFVQSRKFPVPHVLYKHLQNWLEKYNPRMDAREDEQSTGVWGE